MKKIGTCRSTWLALRRSFWYGWAFATGFHMFIQDWMGLEDYLVFAREHWWDVHWIVGLLITAGSLYLWTNMLGRFEWLNEEKEKEHGS